MSRYIDADALWEYANNQKDKSVDANDFMRFPYIDIVRCKECRHGTYCEEAEMYICNANDQDLCEAEHFCSYGERAEQTEPQTITAEEKTELLDAIGGEFFPKTETQTDCSWK